MNCLRCGSPMYSQGFEYIQLGKAGVFTGAWSNIFSGALKVHIYQCENCGKLEFFHSEKAGPFDDTSQDEKPEGSYEYDSGCSEEAVSFDGMPQRKCPECGFQHDFDYPKCPKCGYCYYNDM